MSVKLEQILKIKPANELTFVGPFTQAVSSVMYLTNPSDRKVCFKIKTTAPKRYCVKPNSGVVDPDESVKISVSLQPFEFDPQEKNKHKFMVQSMYAPEGEINQEILWKEADSSQLMDSKLKCVFVLPDPSGGAVPGAPNDVGSNGRPWPQTGQSEVNSAISNQESVAGSSSVDSKQFTTIKGEALSQGDMVVGEGDINLKKSVDEIKKLQEELSALRQENILLREEALRQQRLASSRSGAASSEGPSSSTGISGGSSNTDSGGFTVSAMNPDANALSVNYLYMALAVLVLGIILGKWIF